MSRDETATLPPVVSQLVGMNTSKEKKGKAKKKGRKSVVANAYCGEHTNALNGDL